MADTDRVRIRIRRGDWEYEAEGPKDFVEASVAAAKEEFQGSLRIPPPTTTEVTHQRETGQRSGTSGTRIRLKEFIDEKSPKGHIEVITALAYWARENEGLQDLGKEELERLYKIAELRRPTDSRNAMAQVKSQKGWLDSVGGGRYKLTAAGEDFVNLDLPRKR